MEQIKHQAEIAMDEADDRLCCFWKRRDHGWDEYVTRILYKTHKPVILAVNKVDNPEMRNDIYDFYAFGTANHYRSPLSTDRNWGCSMPSLKIFRMTQKKKIQISSNLADWSPKCWEVKLDQCDPRRRRVIASPVAGTTRDAIDTHFTDADGQEFTMIDTAGMRKSGKIMKTLEKYSSCVPCVPSTVQMWFWWSLMPKKDSGVWQADRWLCSWSW